MARSSLFLQLVISLGLLVVGVMLALGYVLIHQAGENFRAARLAQATAITKTLAGGSVDALITHDYELLERWVKSAKPTDSYAYAYLSRPDGRILVHTEIAQAGRDIHPVPGNDGVTVRDLRYNGEPVREVIFPARVAGRHLANAHTAIYLSTDAEIFSEITESIGFQLFVAFAVLIGGVFLVARHLTAPLESLTRTFSAISFEEPSKRASISTDLKGRSDEIGELVRAFDEMIERVHDSYQRFRNLVEGSIQGTFVQVDWRPVFVNQSMVDMFGFDSAEEMLAVEDMSQFVAPHERQRIRDNTKRRLAGEEVPNAYEFDGLRKDGSEIRCLVLLRVVRWDGEDAVQGTIIDVTQRHVAEEKLKGHLEDMERSIRERTMHLSEEIAERRQIQEALIDLNRTLDERVTDRTEELKAEKARAELANRAKTEFLQNMSHELRTPLNAIMGFSDIIRQETLGKLNNKAYGEYVDDIYHSAEFLLSIIGDILDISKIEEGELEVDPSPFELRPAIEACLPLVQGRIQSKELKLNLNLPPAFLFLDADERRFKQVLINLLSNAIKFTPKGGHITLTVEWEKERGLTLVVSDTGIGIAPDDIEHVLEPFGRVESSLNTVTQGTGLGLPICKALMEAHGGRLLLVSEVGVGTVVRAEFSASQVLEEDEPEFISSG